MNVWNDNIILEIQYSDTALRKGITNIIPGEQLAVWRLAWEQIYYPIAEALDPGHVRWGLSMPIELVSGYRCPKLNRTLGGSSNSQHRGFFRKPMYLGRKYHCAAFDIKPRAEIPYSRLLDTVRKLMKKGAPIDQLIDEYERWIHISFAAPCLEPRRMELRKG